MFLFPYDRLLYEDKNRSKKKSYCINEMESSDVYNENGNAFEIEETVMSNELRNDVGMEMCFHDNIKIYQANNNANIFSEATGHS